MLRLDDLPNLDATGRDSLASVGIENVDALRMATLDAQGRSAIASLVARPTSLVRTWSRLLDLTRLPGVDGAVAEQLIARGLSTVRLVATADAVDVQDPSLAAAARGLPVDATFPEDLVDSGAAGLAAAGAELAVDGLFAAMRDLGSRALATSVLAATRPLPAPIPADPGPPTDGAGGSALDTIFEDVRATIAAENPDVADIVAAIKRSDLGQPFLIPPVRVPRAADASARLAVGAALVVAGASPGGNAVATDIRADAADAESKALAAVGALQRGLRRATASGRDKALVAAIEQLAGAVDALGSLTAGIAAVDLDRAGGLAAVAAARALRVRIALAVAAARWRAALGRGHDLADVLSAAAIRAKTPPRTVPVVTVLEGRAGTVPVRVLGRRVRGTSDQEIRLADIDEPARALRVYLRGPDFYFGEPADRCVAIRIDPARGLVGESVAARVGTDTFLGALADAAAPDFPLYPHGLDYLCAPAQFEADCWPARVPARGEP